MIKTLPIESFLSDLAAKQSTPGGGSVAALSGAMGAGLISMVAHFTIGKTGYEAVQDEMSTLLKDAEHLRDKLTAAIQDDIVVFDRVMAAYRAPKDTSRREDELQDSLKMATDVPLECAGLCCEVMQLSRLAVSGNKNVISDVGVAVLMGYTGLKSAALNVYINLGGVKDVDFVNDRQAKIAALLDSVQSVQEEVYQEVKSKL